MQDNVGLDTHSGDYEAWERAMNVKLMDDISTAGTAALLVTPAGWGATAIGGGATLAGLYADYLEENSVEGMASATLQYGFGELLLREGVSRVATQRIVAGMTLSGAFEFPDDLDSENE